MLDEQVKELLPDNIRNAMQSLQEKTNATDEITLPVTLAVATFATQGIANANPLIWDECALSNYYCVLVPSGGLKTSISDMMLEGAKRFELEHWKIAEEADTEYQIQLKKYESYIRDQAKKKDDPLLVPQIIPAVQTPFTKINKPKYPRTARYMASKFTLNGMINALRGVPHFGIFNSDAGEFFNSHAFTRDETSVEIISALSRLWSGEQIDKLTGIEDIVTVGKRTTALFMLQQELANFFVNPQFKDQGFQHRILITQSDKIQKRQYTLNDIKNKSKTKDEHITQFNDRVYELLSSVDKIQQKPRTNNLLELRRHLSDNDERDINRLVLDRFPVCTTDTTQEIYLEVYNEMANKAEEEYYSEYKNFMNRAFEHFVRLANVLAIFDGKDMVTEREATCAYGLIHYFIEQRMNLNIDGKIKIDPIVTVAKQIEDYLLKKFEGTEITKTVLNDYGPNAYRKLSVRDRDRVIDELQSRDIVELEKDGRKLVLKILRKSTEKAISS